MCAEHSRSRFLYWDLTQNSDLFWSFIFALCLWNEKKCQNEEYLSDPNVLNHMVRVSTQVETFIKPCRHTACIKEVCSTQRDISHFSGDLVGRDTSLHSLKLKA